MAKESSDETGNVNIDNNSDSECQTGRKWEADVDALNMLWPGTNKILSLEDAFSLEVILDDKISYKVPIHLFGSSVNITPYHDGDNAIGVDGTHIGRGDIELSQYFPPGKIGFAIKHHRPSYRLMTPNMEEDALKEHLKLQDTHIELVIGVERKSKPGVITLNNPQDYPGGEFGPGRFGTPDYSMIFFEPIYPSFLPEEIIVSFTNNIRTMMVAFNAVSDFPGDYNGGDPLAVHNIDKLREHVREMVYAIAGDINEASVARKWFEKPENMIYCAELAHVSASAGIHFPLNKRTIEPLVGEIVWRKFINLVAKHNLGEPTPFTELNRNKLSILVKLEIAPEDLLTISEYAPEDNRAELSSKLAFEPMTMADIIRYALALHVPRKKLGENVAPLQAQILQKMKPGILEEMGMNGLDPSDQRRQIVDQLFDEIVIVVGHKHDDYDAFQSALEPYMANARKITGPRHGSETGEGYFVPPSLLHLVAQGYHTGGLLGLNYVGHGLHFSLLKIKQ